MEKRYGLVTDYSGNVVPGSTITVTNYPSGTIASLFRDNAGTPEDNPFVANDADGRYTFYAADGRYRIDIAPPLDANLSASSVIDVILSDTAYLQKASKAEVAALPLTQFDAGKKVFITSADGGEFTIRYNATPGTYADNGGPFCGTVFIPTGGDGTIGIVRDNAYPFKLEWFGGGENETAATNDTAFTNAITAMPSTGGKLRLKPRVTYEKSAVLSWTKNNVTIEGEDTWIKKTASSHFIDVGNTSLLVTTEGNTLASNATKGDTTLSLTAGKGANFTADTWVVLRNTSTAEGGASVTNTAAEYVFIESISTDTLNLASPIKFNHTTANSAEVQRVNFVETPVLRGIRFDGDFITSGSVNNDNGIIMTFCKNPIIEDVEGEKLPNVFVGLQGCLGARVDGLKGRDQLSDGIDGATGNFGYTLVELDLNEGLVANNIQAERTRHAYTTATLSLGFGLPIGSRITNGVAKQMRGSGWDTHPEGKDIEFHNCITIGSQAHGMQDRSLNTKWIGCHSRDCIGTALYISSDATGTKTRNFTFENTNLGTWNSVDWTTKDPIQDDGAVTEIDGMIKKWTDQLVNNTTTLANDNELYVPIRPHEKLTVRATIKYFSGTTPDIKFTFTGPSGSTVAWGPENNGRWDATGTYSLTGLSASGVAKDFYGAGGTIYAKLACEIENGATAGNLQFQFAQQTADASNTYVVKDSFLEVIRH